VGEGKKAKEIYHSSSSILNNSALAKATDDTANIRPQMWFNHNGVNNSQQYNLESPATSTVVDNPVMDSNMMN